MPHSLAKIISPLQERPSGEMAEWLKAHAWKACVRETVPWVRIPLSPPVHTAIALKLLDDFPSLARSCPMAAPDHAVMRHGPRPGSITAL
jgi:hypothetical protein